MVSDEAMVDDDGVVRIGSVLFALIRPNEGRDLAFNHWYERDHYYTAGVAAPGVFSAGRFIEPVERLHLAAYFVLPGHDAARVAFAAEQYALAADDDRLFVDRVHLHTWSYTVESSSVGVDGVSPALVLDRRYEAVTVVWCDADVAVPDAAVVLTMAPVTPVMPSSWDDGIDPTKRRMVLAFHDGELESPSGPGVHWSARFDAAVFGTDTHVAR
ncbi:MAG: hypothetical protein AAF548_01695 [Actinomycetota bacterium]